MYHEPTNPPVTDQHLADEIFHDRPVEHAEPYPALLGMGVFSLSGEAGAYPVDRQTVCTDHLFETDLQFGFSETKRALFEKLRISANASFKGFGAKASLSIDFARSLQKTSRTVYITASKYLVRRRYTLVRPRLTRDAELFRRSYCNSELLHRYGDRFVSSVDVGGFCHLVFALETESESEAQSLSVRWGFKYGKFNSSGSVAHELMKEFSDYRLSLAVKSAGVAQVVPTKGVGAASYVDTLLEYFDTFEEKMDDDQIIDTDQQDDAAKLDGRPVIIDYRSVELARAVAEPFPEQPDILERQAALDRAGRVKEKIEERLGELELASALAVRSGRVVNYAPVIRQFQSDVDYLEEYGRRTMSLRLPLERCRISHARETDPFLLPRSWRSVGFASEIRNDPPACAARVTSGYRGGPLYVCVAGHLDNASEIVVRCHLLSGNKVELAEERAVVSDLKQPFQVEFVLELDREDIENPLVHVTLDTKANDPAAKVSEKVHTEVTVRACPELREAASIGLAPEQPISVDKMVEKSASDFESAPFSQAQEVELRVQ